MAGTTTEEKNLRFYNLKSKADGQHTPHFALIGKVGDKWETIKEFNTMEGRIIGAKIKERTDDKGKTIKSFILVFHDGNEESNVNMNHTQLAYSIINSLSSLPEISGNVSIVVKKKEDGKYINPVGYVKHDGQDVKWAVHMNETPRKKAVMVPDPNNEGAQMHLEVNGEKVWDSTELKAYWEKFFTENLIPKITTHGPIDQSAASKAFIDEINEPVTPETPEEDEF